MLFSVGLGGLLVFKGYLDAAGARFSTHRLGALVNYGLRVAEKI